MKIGDEVFVHGYVDEIRKDVIIIRNDGGYFGTVEDEIVNVEIKAWNKDYQEPYCEVADTPQTDCEGCKHYKLACELFSEVCKYEPTTQTETQNSNLTFEKGDTPQTDKEDEPYICDTCKYSDKEWYEEPCECCHNNSGYKPKTEDESVRDVVRGFMSIVNDMRNPTEEEKESVNKYIESISVPTGVNVFDLMDEPQTDCPWK